MEIMKRIDWKRRLVKVQTMIWCLGIQSISLLYYTFYFFNLPIYTHIFLSSSLIHDEEKKTANFITFCLQLSVFFSIFFLFLLFEHCKNIINRKNVALIIGFGFCHCQGIYGVKIFLKFLFLLFWEKNSSLNAVLRAFFELLVKNLVLC